MFKHKKSLGQNFINDENLLADIAEKTGATKDDLVIEIGPGSGMLTAELAKIARRVVAVEIDKDLIPILNANLATLDNVEVINADILKVNFEEIIHGRSCDLHEDDHSRSCTLNEDGHGRSCGNDASTIRIVGNLPYYITTPILLGLLEQKVPAKTITVMVQKEVAEKIVSGPGDENYGVLAVLLQYYCDVKYEFTVDKEYFTPKPKVDSAVVNMTVKEQREFSGSDEEKFFKLVKASFAQRRKTLANGLVGFNGHAKQEVIDILNSIGIDPNRRAETLNVKEFCLLSGRI